LIFSGFNLIFLYKMSQSISQIKDDYVRIDGLGLESGPTPTGYNPVSEVDVDMDFIIENSNRDRSQYHQYQTASQDSMIGKEWEMDRRDRSRDRDHDRKNGNGSGNGMFQIPRSKNGDRESRESRGNKNKNNQDKNKPIPAELVGIQLGRRTANQVRENSLFSLIYSKDRGKGISRILEDSRLTANNSRKCETCNKVLECCVGHRSHIELSMPAIHQMDQKPALSVLKNTCVNCSESLMVTGAFCETPDTMIGLSCRNPLPLSKHNCDILHKESRRPFSSLNMFDREPPDNSENKIKQEEKSDESILTEEELNKLLKEREELTKQRAQQMDIICKNTRVMSNRKRGEKKQKEDEERQVKIKHATKLVLKINSRLIEKDRIFSGCLTNVILQKTLLEDLKYTLENDIARLSTEPKEKVNVSDAQKQRLESLNLLKITRVESLNEVTVAYEKLKSVEVAARKYITDKVNTWVTSTTGLHPVSPALNPPVTGLHPVSPALNPPATGFNSVSPSLNPVFETTLARVVDEISRVDDTAKDMNDVEDMEDDPDPDNEKRLFQPDTKKKKPTKKSKQDLTLFELQMSQLQAAELEASRTALELDKCNVQLAIEKKETEEKGEKDDYETDSNVKIRIKLENETEPENENENTAESEQEYKEKMTSEKIKREHEIKRIQKLIEQARQDELDSYRICFDYKQRYANALKCFENYGDDQDFEPNITVRDQTSWMQTYLAHAMTRAKKHSGTLYCAQAYGGCGTHQPNISKNGMRIMMDYPSQTNLSHVLDGGFNIKSGELHTSQVQSILRRITPENQMFLGFSKHAPAETLVQQVLAVPPVTTLQLSPKSIRYINLIISYETMQRDRLAQIQFLTGKMPAIGEVNRDPYPSPLAKQFIATTVDILNYTAAIIGSAPLIPKGENAFVTWHQQKFFASVENDLTFLLGDKEGDWRSQMNGKRIPKSGRSVIICNTSIPADHVVYGEDLARLGVYKVKVTSTNIAKVHKKADAIFEKRTRLKKIIHEKQLMELRGETPTILGEEFTAKDFHFRDVYPSCRFIHKRKNNIIKLNTSHLNEPYSERIEIGDYVEFSIDEDAVVLTNRQPSLTKFCIMANKVIIQIGGGFFIAFNPNALKQYNGDYDGDTITYVVVDKMDAQTEAIKLMSAEENILGPEANNNILAFVQDTIQMVYRFTHTNSLMNKTRFRYMCEMLHQFKDRDCVTECRREYFPPAVVESDEKGDGNMDDLSKTKRELWSWRQLFSMALPRGLYYERSPVKWGAGSGSGSGSESKSGNGAPLVSPGGVNLSTLPQHVRSQLSPIIPKHLSEPECWLSKPRTMLDCTKDLPIILDGKLVSGVLTGEDMGEGETTLMKTIAVQFSQKQAFLFHTDMQALMRAWSMLESTSFTMSDIGLSQKTRSTIQENMKRLAKDEVQDRKQFVEQMAKHDAHEQKIWSIGGLGRIAPKTGVSFKNKLIESMVMDHMIKRTKLISDIVNEDIAKREMPKPECLFHKHNTGLSKCTPDCMKQTFQGCNFLTMIFAKSKGKPVDFIEMTAHVGPQLIENIMLPMSVNGRVLPYYASNLTADEHGYGTTSFSGALSVFDWIPHDISTRRKVSDSHTKVHTVGTIQHQILTMLEGAVSHVDGSVRDEYGRILTFMYGGDGANGETLVPVTYALVKLLCDLSVSSVIPSPSMSLFPIKWDLTWPHAPLLITSPSNNETLLKQIIIDNFCVVDYDRIEEASREANCLYQMYMYIWRPMVVAQMKPFIHRMFSFIDIDTSIEWIRYRFGISSTTTPDPSSQSSSLIPSAPLAGMSNGNGNGNDQDRDINTECTPNFVTRQVDALCRQIHSHNNELFRHGLGNKQHLAEFYIRSCLSTKRVIQYYRLTKWAFQILLDEILNAFIISRVTPMRTIGFDVGTSIGRPQTQIVLNTKLMQSIVMQGSETAARLKSVTNVKKLVPDMVFETILTPYEIQPTDIVDATSATLLMSSMSLESPESKTSITLNGMPIVKQIQIRRLHNYVYSLGVICENLAKIMAIRGYRWVQNDLETERTLQWGLRQMDINGDPGHVVKMEKEKETEKEKELVVEKNEFKIHPSYDYNLTPTEFERRYHDMPLGQLRRLLTGFWKPTKQARSDHFGMCLVKFCLTPSPGKPVVIEECKNLMSGIHHCMIINHGTASKTFGDTIRLINSKTIGNIQLDSKNRISNMNQVLYFETFSESELLVYRHPTIPTIYEIIPKNKIEQLLPILKVKNKSSLQSMLNTEPMARRMMLIKGDYVRVMEYSNTRGFKDSYCYVNDDLDGNYDAWVKKNHKKPGSKGS